MASQISQIDVSDSRNAVVLLEGDPHLVLEGMLIAAYATGADRGFNYNRKDSSLELERRAFMPGSCRNRKSCRWRIAAKTFSYESRRGDDGKNSQARAVRR